MKKKWGADRHAEKLGEYLAKTYVPKRCAAKFKKAHAGKSKALAIVVKCQECCGFEEVTANIRYCHSWTCPLWAVRPYQVEGDPSGMIEAEVLDDQEPNIDEKEDDDGSN